MMVAADIINLISKKHSKDLVVPECKNGPSAGYTHMRMDAWVMARSWSHPLVTAYEVKVSRQDFLNDRKWMDYRQYCNEFYFACPAGLIQPNELPEDVGLYWASKSGLRLFNKKKAVFTECGNMEDVFRYILMSRAEIRPPEKIGRTIYEANEEFWKEWLVKKELSWNFGQVVGKKIQERIREEITSVQERIHAVERENENLWTVKEFISENGFQEVCGRWVWKTDLDKMVCKLKKKLPPDFREKLEDLIEKLTEVYKDLEVMED